MTKPMSENEAILRLRVWLAAVRDETRDSEVKQHARTGCVLVDLIRRTGSRGLKKGLSISLRHVITVLEAAGFQCPIPDGKF